MLPSKYAPGGISPDNDKKVLTLGQKRHTTSNYTVRLIEDRVNNAIRHPEQYYGTNDIEMVPMDSFDEVHVITDYVANSRSHGEFSYDDMELDSRYNQTETITLEGNKSYLVVDTNFILSHLRILDELKDLGQQYGLVLVIPIAVMQELDGLKGSSKIEHHNATNLSGKSVGYLARWANDWVYSCLADRVPTVVGQKLHERLNRLAVKDDAILDCCMYLQKHHMNTLQVLMSNDKNLCLKALLNDVLTVSYRKDMSGKIIAEMVQGENFHRFGKIERDTVVNREVEVPIHQENVYVTVYNEIQRLVLSVVRRCMVKVFGEDIGLLQNYDNKSVQTLEDAVKVMVDFSNEVFAEYFRHRKPFESSDRTVKMVDVPDSRLDLLAFIDFWSQILHVLYQNVMDDKQNADLQMLVLRWEELASTC